MKLKFSNGESFLFPDNIEPENRLILINELLSKKLKFDGDYMTVEEYFSFTWNKSTTINMMDRIATYLSKMPNQNGKEDKEILSKNNISEMNKGYYWTTTKDKKRVSKPSRYQSFSELDEESKGKLGLVENNEDK